MVAVKDQAPRECDYVLVIHFVVRQCDEARHGRACHFHYETNVVNYQKIQQTLLFLLSSDYNQKMRIVLAIRPTSQYLYMEQVLLVMSLEIDRMQDLKKVRKISLKSDIPCKLKVLFLTKISKQELKDNQMSYFSNWT